MIMPLEAFETPTCKIVIQLRASIGANASAPSRTSDIYFSRFVHEFRVALYF